MIVSGTIRLWIYAIVCATALCTRPVFAYGTGFNIWLAGRIDSIDNQHGMLVIGHGPTETMDAGVETCTLTQRALRQVRTGMNVEVQVDTRRHPWKILHLRVYRRSMRLSSHHIRFSTAVASTTRQKIMVASD